MEKDIGNKNYENCENQRTSVYIKDLDEINFIIDYIIEVLEDIGGEINYFCGSSQHLLHIKEYLSSIDQKEVLQLMKERFYKLERLLCKY